VSAAPVPPIAGEESTAAAAMARVVAVPPAPRQVREPTRSDAHHAAAVNRAPCRGGTNSSAPCASILVGYLFLYIKPGPLCFPTIEPRR
jgi:hypothetical protein